MGLFTKVKSLLNKSSSEEAKLDKQFANKFQTEESSKTSERRAKQRVNAVPGSKILIIDDSKTICSMLKKMMLQNDYKAFTALSAEEGLEAAFKVVPDLIFLDIVLPEMDGFAALRKLRRDPRTKDIPIMMMSGNHQATEIFYASRIGADDFLKKPFSRYELFFRIEKMLNADLKLVRKN
ncbi:PleD family two-component system response regulator [Kangiella sp. HZ709]|uniref:response regulator n=1 Tax=Kangiella sp. HZ709 TaxID=2666328 RepID=UPI0012B01FD9|nr:response regulator [Kangiella sp. HZ709]MRX26758.1 response regulator [Kangiella sp. HZ709]